MTDRITALVSWAYGGKYAGLVHATGVSSSLISRWVHDGVVPSLSTLVKIERAAGWSATWLETGALPAVAASPSHAHELVSRILAEALSRGDHETAEAARYLLGHDTATTTAPARAAGPVAATPAEQQGAYLPPLSEIEQPVYPRQHTLTIPYYEQPVNAGAAVPLELVTPTLLVFDYLTHPRPSALFAVPVAGDSMLGAGIVPGSRLVCERIEADATRAMDRIVIACTADGTVVKRLTRSASGTVVLRSDNPIKTYPDIPVDETVRIQAIVIKVLTDL